MKNGKLKNRTLKCGVSALLLLALSLTGMTGCAEKENGPQEEEETVEVWQGEEKAEQEGTEAEKGQEAGEGEQNKGNSAAPTGGDDRIRFSQEEGNLYATITADLPAGTMVQVLVTGQNYRYETRYKVRNTSSKVGPITREGKPLTSGTFELSWEPLPTHTQIEEIRNELRRKSISGGKKSVTLPM